MKRLQSIICFCFVSASLYAADNYQFRVEKNEGWKPGEAQLNQPQGLNRFNKATGLIGMEVKNPKSENLGSIKDLMLDMQMGRLTYAVFGSGGFLGLGDKLIALPPNALTQSQDERFLVLNADKESIRSAGTFDTHNWPTVADADWNIRMNDRLSKNSVPRVEIRESAGAERTNRVATPSSTEKDGWVEGKDHRDQASSGSVVESSESIASAPENRFIKASDLIGMNVKNMQGEKLGDIADVAVDLKSGRILYAALSSGGFLGIENRLFAVPIDLLKHSGEAKTLTLDISSDLLKSNPGFVKNHWPDTADKRFYAKGTGLNEPAGKERK